MARRARREPTVPSAPVALDAAGEALSVLLSDIFGAREGVSVGAEIDEVTLSVPPETVADICAACKTDPRLDFDYLRCLSVVDYESQSGELEVNYHLYSLKSRRKMVVKARTPADAPSAPTVTGVWSGANWYERESADLFGVTFIGHPNPSPLLLYEGFEGFPGRKSFPFHDYDEW